MSRARGYGWTIALKLRSVDSMREAPANRDVEATLALFNTFWLAEVQSAFPGALLAVLLPEQVPYGWVVLTVDRDVAAWAGEAWDPSLSAEAIASEVQDAFESVADCADYLVRAGAR